MSTGTKKKRSRIPDLTAEIEEIDHWSEDGKETHKEKCTSCKGRGLLMSAEGEMIECYVCNGSGDRSLPGAASEGEGSNGSVAPRARANGKPRRAPPADGPRVRIDRQPVEPRELDPARIDPSPYQPRQDFPADEIRDLAETIRVQGQLQPILVRAVGDRWELLDGERRLRAVRLLKSPTVRAEVIDASDADARAIVLVSCLQRKDLNAIEKARAMRALLDAGDVPTQAELAKRLGVTQGHVADLLRLLELPEACQGLVISGEIPRTAARFLLPIKDQPKIVAAVVKRVKQSLKQQPGEISRDEMEEMVREETRERTRSLERNEYVDGNWRNPFKPTAEQLEQLGVIEAYDYQGKPERRVTNVKLFDELAAAAEAKRAEREEKRAASKEQKLKAAKKDPEKLTPAQREKLAKEEAEHQKELARVFAGRLFTWKTNWQRRLVAAYIRDQATVEDLVRLLLLSLREWDARNYRSSQYGDLEVCLGRVADGLRFKDGVEGLTRADDGQAIAAARAVLAELFFCEAQANDEDGEMPYRPCEMVPPEDVERLIAYFGIDLASCWADEQAGSLSEAYWNLHTKDQLVELGRELKVEVTPAQKKTEAVAMFMARIPTESDTASQAGDKAVALPKEIKKAKRPKGRYC